MCLHMCSMCTGICACVGHVRTAQRNLRLITVGVFLREKKKLLMALILDLDKVVQFVQILL